ncbi:MAG: site-2 protease family protein [Oscillochloris sp.]|nr:site-2 protease family protein [Oscillochloris sp.]
MEPDIHNYEFERQREELRSLASEVMQIEAEDELEARRLQGVRFRGRLLVDAETAYNRLAPQFRLFGRTLMMQEDRAGAALLVLPALPAARPSRLWVALLLLALTIASTTFIGGFTQTGFDIWQGLGYSAALLGILLAHELGHYIVARREGVAVSYPFFIPAPIFLLGTMGAFISIKEPVPNRRALLAIGIAGPLAGLVVAIPVLLFGLSISPVQTIVPTEGSFTEGNSLLYAAMKLLVFGRFLPSGGEDVFLHPVALAGWAGLLVTGLNLLPAGQLDGGHIFYALFGARAASIMSMLVAGCLVALGFLWNGWFIWAILVALMGQQHSPLLNGITPLRGGWRWLAVLGLIVFILVFTPIPLTVSSP